LHHIPTDRAILDHASLEHILSVLDKKGVAYWWDGPVEEFLPASLRQGAGSVGGTWRKGTDTMDVWFDSGTSWSILDESCIESKQVLEGRDRVLRADVCLEGSDQHRGWFQSQLLTAVASAAEDAKHSSPYRTLITHGMVLDQDGRKMSKSLGNVTSPMAIVNGGKVRLFWNRKT
jgi:isoleucyl-tRNA synthetase